MMRRRGRPGLMGTAARTAVVVGTATAVSGSMQRNQQQKAAAAQNQAAQSEAAMDAKIQAEVDAQLAQAQAAQPVQAPPAAGGDDTMAKLQEYAAMKQQGLLTEEEFAALKAKLLGI